jgi:hypothetical protein
VSRADLFIATFGPSSNNQGLRTSRLEQEEQVKLAFYGIDATRARVAAGELSDADGWRITEGFESTIRNYVHDRSQDALIKSAAGRASDIPAISQLLSGVLGVARQDGLMGREELALEAQQQMVRALRTFSQSFASTCEQQDFPAEVALGLERQNELLGTGISVIHCANRRVSADISSQGVLYHFETCTLRGDNVDDHWDLTISGLVTGKGNGLAGMWEATTMFRGKSDDWTGDMKLIKEEVEESQRPITVPDDAGPLAKPNGWPKQPVMGGGSVPQKITLQKLRIQTINMIGNGRGYMGMGQWAEGVIQHQDKPCSPRAE